MLYSHNLNTTKFVWPIGGRINWVPLYMYIVILILSILIFVVMKINMDSVHTGQVHITVIHGPVPTESPWYRMLTTGQGSTFCFALEISLQFSCTLHVQMYTQLHLIVESLLLTSALCSSRKYPYSPHGRFFVLHPPPRKFQFIFIHLF